MVELDIVTMPEGRALHGIYLICKTVYQKAMAEYLADQGVFVTVDKTWAKYSPPSSHD